MVNIKLVGFDTEKRESLFKRIRMKLATQTRIDHMDIAVTLLQQDRGSVFNEKICVYGYEDNAEHLSHISTFFPERMDISLIHSEVKTLGGKKTPYVEIHAHDVKKIDELIEYAKGRRLRLSVEKHQIGATQNFRYPCLKVISDDEDRLGILCDILKSVRGLNVKSIYPEQITGFVEAYAMR